MKRFLSTRPKPGGLLARAGLLAALVAVSVGSVIDPGTTTAAGLDDKLQHVLAFALLALLCCTAMPERARWRWVLPVLLGCYCRVHQVGGAELPAASSSSNTTSSVAPSPVLVCTLTSWWLRSRVVRLSSWAGCGGATEQWLVAWQ